MSAIDTGDGWFGAWQRQAATPFPVIEKRIEIAIDRLMELSHGAPVSEAELEALCRLWNVDVEQVESTMQAGPIEGQRPSEAAN